jgi:thiol-disulfide isomerase/thioredoxin
LGSLQAMATAPTGTGLDLQLPFGSLMTSTLDQRRTDRGLGDLETRARQSLTRFWPISRLDLAVSLGAVLPTGGYIERSGAANLPPEAAGLTLGRGVYWWLAEVDARVSVSARLAGLAQVSGRGPLDRTRDDFAWGPELRTTIGVRLAATPRVSVLAMTDVQLRGRATEPDPFTQGRLDSANVGGWQWSLSPSVAVALTSDWAVVIGARVPVLSDVVGNQLVPQTGGFVSLSYARRLVAPRTPTAAPSRAAAGMITVVDYWATWCAPCTEISRQLGAAAARWPDVRIVKIDASRGPDEGGPRLPAGSTGLPVIELFDTNGRRAALLVGEEALRVVEKVDALRAAHREPPGPITRGELR